MAGDLADAAEAEDGAAPAGRRDSDRVELGDFYLCGRQRTDDASELRLFHQSAALDCAGDALPARAAARVAMVGGGNSRFGGGESRSARLGFPVDCGFLGGDVWVLWVGAEDSGHQLASWAVGRIRTALSHRGNRARGHALAGNVVGHVVASFAFRCVDGRSAAVVWSGLTAVATVRDGISAIHRPHLAIPGGAVRV